jgi:hypothetical protein
MKALGSVKHPRAFSVHAMLFYVLPDFLTFWMKGADVFKIFN